MLEDRIRDLFGIEIDVNDENRIISIKDSSILGLQLDLLEKAIFEEKNEVYTIRFEKCVFNTLIGLNGNLCSELNFFECVFKESVSFAGVRIERGVGFFRSTFCEKAIFNQTSFK